MTIIPQGVSNQFGFIRSSICLQCKISGSSAFSIFFPNKISHHQERKVWSQFLKNTSDWLGWEGLKSPKVRLLGFWQNLIHLDICFFNLARKCQCFFDFLQKQHVCKISGSWFMVQKPENKSDCRILQTAISHNKLKVWSWLSGYDYRSKKALSISRLLQVRVLRHAWTAQSDNR